MKLKENQEKTCHIAVSNPNNKNKVCMERNSSTSTSLGHSAVDVRRVITCKVQVNRTSWLRQNNEKFCKLQTYAFLKQNNLTTSEMVSISTSQTFRSWVVIFHHRRPMACLSLNLYDTPGLATRMNVLFWRPGDFPVSYSNRDTFWNAWNRHSGSFMVDTGILLSNME